jgi:two pore calcium channel protein
MYFFAALGMCLYGGFITRNPDDSKSYLLLGTIFADSAYWANNFNDMLSGMNVLFNLLVVNNWFVIEDGFEATTEGRWVRLYFFSFHILGVILVNNLVIAFIINNFLEQLAGQRERAEEEIIVEGSDAVIRDRRAILMDASQITGTRTSLTGKYIARLGHAHSDIVDENHHHDRLRAMFTQSNSSSQMENELSTPE